MRVGTVLRYETKEFGTSFGVVNTLIDPNTVRVNDQNGGEYIVRRGQGHKIKHQDGKRPAALRDQFGITMGPCQKETFGADVVHVAENKYVEQVRTKKIEIPTTVERVPIPLG